MLPAARTKNHKTKLKLKINNQRNEETSPQWASKHAFIQIEYIFQTHRHAGRATDKIVFCYVARGGEGVLAPSCRAPQGHDPIRATTSTMSSQFAFLVYLQRCKSRF